MLCRLNVNSYQTEDLLSMQEQPEETGISKFAIAMIVMVVALFFMLIGFAAEAPGLGVFCLIVAFIALIAGVVAKQNTTGK